MLWFPTLSKSGFRSIICDNDELSTGKWLVPLAVPDIGGIWEEIEDAAVEGRILAAKKSTHELVRIIGHNLACVYCSASDPDAVAETLRTLREIGVDGELKYKSDLATFDGREEYLYSSSEFETLLPRP
ncbi:DUF1917 domain-containing protein [Rhizobium leguminosarum]|uniref:DUF1917 domain-containing protein n=1 Tax=Rhizobium leguminosarum TaxID=384 RepID=UPI001C966BDF|nr:DUF1917 domain-containing protein [Rhizobium leguminosarum]MBY5407409.1 DUF1917 domain-containing protein [Rhizobium leguminosarum]